MRSVRYLALASAIAFASHASAKDITLILNDQEQQAFVQVLDAATRTGGLAATQGTVFFYNKLQTAINATNAPAQVAEKPKAGEPKQEPAKLADPAPAPAPGEPSK